MNFIINAYDGTDKDALDRRMAVRPDHLDNMRRLMAEGRVLCAGGKLDEAGKMIGSFLIMDFDSREALDKYFETEPYVTGNVWQDIQVEICNAVIVDNVMVGK